jgi:hypothetical protein
MVSFGNLPNGFEASLRFWECKGSGKPDTYASTPTKLLVNAGAA